MYEQMFREANIPITAMVAEAGSDLYTPGATAELWLEDEALLDDPEVRTLIQNVLHGPDREASIEMPTLLPEVEPEQPPGISWPVSWWIMVTVGTIVGIPLLVFLVVYVVKAVLP